MGKSWWGIADVASGYTFSAAKKQTLLAQKGLATTPKACLTAVHLHQLDVSS